MALYVCGGDCNRTLPISELYFCTTCPKLACQYCVTEEIDSYYCPNCLENLASAEASSLQNRCKKCFGCPICFTALVASSNAAGDLFFFSCGYCRWSSLDIGMKADQLVKLIADQNSRERNNTGQQAITALVDELRREMKTAEKERRLRERFRLRRAAIGTAPLDATPTRATLANVEAERQAKDQAVSFQEKRSASQKPVVNTPSIEVERDVHLVTSLQQRFALLHSQPRAVSALVPHRIPLMTRRSCRCKGKEGKPCDKLLVKPEFSLTRAEFKRQLSALLLLPALTYRLTAPLHAGQATPFVLGLSNPLKAVVRLTLAVKSAPGVACTVPTQTLTVGCLDPSDLDDQYETEKKEDKPDVVVLRKPNVLCVNCSVTPSQVTLAVRGVAKPATGEMTFAFDVILPLGGAVQKP